MRHCARENYDSALIQILDRRPELFPHTDWELLTYRKELRDRSVKNRFLRAYRRKLYNSRCLIVLATMLIDELFGNSGQAVHNKRLLCD